MYKKQRKPTKEEVRAFNEKYSHLPDMAFFAMADEFGIEPEDFAEAYPESQTEGDKYTSEND